MNKRLFVFWGVLAAVVVATTGGYFVWSKYFKYDLEKVYQEEEQKYIAAMTADTYGGKTPQETLDMFVDALRKEDIELASKYFMLDTDSGSKNYLSHDGDRALLELAKTENRLGEISNVLSRAVLSSDQPTWDKALLFYVVYDQNQNLIADVSLRFNKYSQVWKIESL